MDRKQLFQQINRAHILELKPFEVEVDDTFKTGRQKRLYPKQCYKKAYQYIMEHPYDGVMLCHGLYTECSIGHAWIELPCNIVFDGTMQRFYDKEGCYKVEMITKLCEYTLLETAKLLSEHDHYGPWHGYLIP